MNTTTTMTGTAGKKILIVDDDEVILKTTSRKLEGAGYQVTTAVDGSQIAEWYSDTQWRKGDSVTAQESKAVTARQGEYPDLVLLDVLFPPDVNGVTWDGFRIMEWLHRMDATKRIPVILISGAAAEQSKQRASSTGALAFFPKPINFDEMLKVIRAALSADPSRGPLPTRSLADLAEDLPTEPEH